MRLHEFNTPLNESEPKNKASKGVRYNSEVGTLFGLIGRGTFDVAHPELSIPADSLYGHAAVYRDIAKYLAPNYDSEMFGKWVLRGQAIKEKILAKQGSLPGKMGWVGGQNIAGGVADISFDEGPTAGISVKDKSGITLANLTPSSLGLEKETGIDSFSKYAKQEFDDMKQQIFAKVLNIARLQPNVPLAPKDPRFSVTFNPETNTYKCIGKGSSKIQTIDLDAATILGKIEQNAPWQRPFGDWFQANWATEKSMAGPLFTRIAKEYEIIIENHLRGNTALAGMLRFGDQPYYYLTPSSLYFVPSADRAQNLELKYLKYGAADGTSQLFLAGIGNAGSNNAAEIDVYMRYANGMFACNPTVRVQSLQYPEFISWELL